jgi:hypothetical protein
MQPKPTSDSRWHIITARRRGRCDLCGRAFAEGTRIRYQPTTKRVRCVGACPKLVAAVTDTGQADAVAAKRLKGRPLWQGEYVSLYDRDDYWFRKCVVFERSFEGAAGRVAQAKKGGVCPACEGTVSETDIEQLKQAALDKDRERFRASQRQQKPD